MKKIFRPRNLLILFGLGVVVGIVLSKKNSAPAPAYPDPWANPAPATGGNGSASSNGEASKAETADA
jgi:hypothetical protein